MHSYSWRALTRRGIKIIMALEEYSRKRRFNQTPEPPAKLARDSRHRFVVQKHRASHLHYDFRLEMQGVLKSWAVPKGPSLDPADKRLAMHVEDHPVEYIDFEGIIPPGNYGAGTVMVWDQGTWEPSPPAGVTPPANAAQADELAAAMLEKGDLKFRLHGSKLNGEFVLAKMRSRRPGSKGTEWLLIKHRDSAAVAGYDIEQVDPSVLTGRSLSEIAADAASPEWSSSRPAARAEKSQAGKNAWLADSIAARDRQQALLAASRRRPAAAKSKSSPAHKSATQPVRKAQVSREKPTPSRTARRASPKTPAQKSASGKPSARRARKTSSSAKARKTSPPAKVQPDDHHLASLKGVVRQPMPSSIRPMLATLVDAPFNSREWLYEVKWDGFRALAFVEQPGSPATAAVAVAGVEAPGSPAVAAAKSLRLVSRNQNDLTGVYPELSLIPSCVRARSAILDGEIVALDDEGRSSFSLMQQRTGSASGPRRLRVSCGDIPIHYYVFDLLYLDGYSLLRVELKQRKELLRHVLAENERVHYSEHFDDGIQLYRAAREHELEGIIAKRSSSCYVTGRSRDWLKIKLTHEQDCVIGGYTDPRGSRQHFGSLVLGLYEGGRLIHVGQAGSGFNARTQQQVWKLLEARKSATNPFATSVEATRAVHSVRPELVARIKFTAWTHEGQSGAIKMRAPVFLGLRDDKNPRECTFERPRSAAQAARLAGQGKDGKAA
jgi:bifunctional non-homologous end joining protein LigD